jgi:TRAP-type C4-dicarboxylate transport system permease small subunit
MKMKKFSVIFDHLIDSLAFIAGSFIFIMMWIECYEIVARYFFHRPTVWSVEFCEYMLFLLAFLGTTWVLKKKAHINVTILVERLKPRAQTYCHLFASFVGILISLIILWFSLKTSFENYVVGVKIVKTYALPKWIFLSFISFGYLLLFIEFIREFLDHLRSLLLKKAEGKTS